MRARRALTALILLLAAASADAQGTGISLGDMSHDSSLPVEVTSDNLSVANESGQATFEGNVVVIQGEMRLAAEQIVVDYSEVPETGATEIQQMVATGGVTFVNGAEAAESEDAVYSPEDGTLLMTGSVLLTQGLTAISGERLTVDLNAGTGVMEGRVRTTFQSEDN